MPDILFRFVGLVATLAQKLTDAAQLNLIDLAGNGFAGWKHALLLYLGKCGGVQIRTER
jgi:hypothetical protein